MDYLYWYDTVQLNRIDMDFILVFVKKRRACAIDLWQERMVPSWRHEVWHPRKTLEQISAVIVPLLTSYSSPNEMGRRLVWRQSKLASEVLSTVYCIPVLEYCRL